MNFEVQSVLFIFIPVETCFFFVCLKHGWNSFSCLCHIISFFFHVIISCECYGMTQILCYCHIWTTYFEHSKLMMWSRKWIEEKISAWLEHEANKKKGKEMVLFMLSIQTWCTNTSCEPSSGVINPQPLITLNHLHFPRRNSELVCDPLPVSKLQWKLNIQEFRKI